jgi:hypothetical protein
LKGESSGKVNIDAKKAELQKYIATIGEEE